MSQMLEETRQQPEALSKTLTDGFFALRDLRREFEARPPRLVALMARGTSDNAAQFGRYLIEITTRIPVSLAAASVLTLYKCPLNLSGVLVVGISQSGESTDTNAVLEDARTRGAVTVGITNQSDLAAERIADGTHRGAVTVGITNQSDSAMAQVAQYVIAVRAGREESVAATKTYTCQLMCLYLLAAALGGQVDVELLRRVPDWVHAVLELEDRAAEIAERYTFMSRAVTVGRGLNYANALEFGLKLMETCYVVAERFSSADLMHGPIALIERSFPVFAFAPPGVTWPSISAMLDRLEELKAETLIITDESNPEAALKPARLIQLPIRSLAPAEPCDLYTPIPYIVPAQLFAAHLAAIKGLNPDRPRTLQKITRTI